VLANILTADGSEVDVQPVRKAWLSTLTVKLEASATRTQAFCAENRDENQFQESEGP
jgi:hypothetical protein